jgi:Zn-dependent peptidase ImmA (M78 family)
MDHAISGVLPDQYPFGFVDYRNTPFNERWDKPSERFADSFAANLLMPADDVRKFHREGRSLIALTSIFEVSEETMKLRLMKLGLELPVHK